MKKIALIIFGITCLNSNAMELEVVRQNNEVIQRKVTPELLGSAYLDSVENRIQARVFNQFDMTGGNASCGYQALHNALVLSKLIFSEDGLQQEALRKALIEKTEKESLFGLDQTPWRKRIAQLRGDQETDRLDTDWLDSDEIRVLSSENIIPAVKRLSHFFALGDIPWKSALISDPFTFHDYEVTDENTKPSAFRQFMKLYHDINKNCLGIFIMYDGEPNVLYKAIYWFKSFVIAENDASLSKASNHGHWHCIIVNKINNEVQFILADSNNNASRLQDKRLNELIALLERRPPEELQLTTQNNLFTVRTIAAALIIAALAGAIARKKLSKTSSSSKMITSSQNGDAEESKEI